MQLGSAPISTGPGVDVDLGLGLQDGGDGLHADGLEVNSAVQEQHQLLVHVGHGGVDDLVDVGQLLAGLVDLPVVGVTNVLVVLALDGILAFLGGEDVRIQGGDARVVPEVVQQFLTGLAHVGELGAADRLGLSQSSLGVAGDGSADHLLEHMLGSEVPLQVNGQSLNEVVLGGAEGDGEGVIVNLGHHSRIAVGILVAVTHALGVDLVQAHVVEEPHAVFSGEGFAVGPLHAFTQVDGVDSGVLVDVKALGDVGLHGAVGLEAEQAFLNGLASVPVAGVGRALQLAAVGADGQVVSVFHHGFHGHTLGHGGQALTGPIGGFGVGGFSRGGDHAQNHEQRQSQGDEFLHNWVPP